MYYKSPTDPSTDVGQEQAKRLADNIAMAIQPRFRV